MGGSEVGISQTGPAPGAIIIGTHPGEVLGFTETGKFLAIAAGGVVILPKASGVETPLVDTWRRAPRYKVALVAEGPAPGAAPGVVAGTPEAEETQTLGIPAAAGRIASAPTATLKAPGARAAPTGKTGGKCIS